MEMIYHGIFVRCDTFLFWEVVYFLPNDACSYWTSAPLSARRSIFLISDLIPAHTKNSMFWPRSQRGLWAELGMNAGVLIPGLTPASEKSNHMHHRLSPLKAKVSDAPLQTWIGQKAISARNRGGWCSTHEPRCFITHLNPANAFGVHSYPVAEPRSPCSVMYLLTKCCRGHSGKRSCLSWVDLLKKSHDVLLGEDS